MAPFYRSPGLLTLLYFPIGFFIIKCVALFADRVDGFYRDAYHQQYVYSQEDQIDGPMIVSLEANFIRPSSSSIYLLKNHSFFLNMKFIVNLTSFFKNLFE